MKEDRESLLNKIRRLYTELFLVSLHDRIHSYRALPPADNHREISGALHQLIDEIVEEVSHNYSTEDYKDTKYQRMVSSLTSVESGNIQSHSTNIASMTLNGLSLYLKNHQAQEDSLHLSGKLQRCVWDHVHSAHRFALTGDGDTAKLHADIACSAMKVLSSYMSDDEYSEFFNEINSQITTK